MNEYLRQLANKSKKIKRQLRFHYENHQRLPQQNPYGREYFSFPKTTKAEHLYPNTIVIKVTPACLGECAYCFRDKQITEELIEVTDSDIAQIFNEYVPNYNQYEPDNMLKIKEILITGGEPFLLNVKFLQNLLDKAKESGIEFIRIGSRAASASPWLVKNELVDMLKDYKPLTIIAHYNHSDELTKKSLEASDKILSAGIAIKNQSVLLRGVNDSAEELSELFWELSRNSIHPYRLNHCMSVGYEALRTTVREGIDLVEEVKNINGTIGHFHYNVITPLGGSPGFTENHIIDEKKGNELIDINSQNSKPEFDISTIDPEAQYLKIKITSKTIWDPNIPKEVWYRDGNSKTT